MSQVLGIDYGEQRIGLAVTDADERVALAHGTIEAQSEEGAIAAIRRMAAELGVTRMVVGLPLMLRGGEGAQARTVRAFGSRLAEATGLPVEYVDERFTSGEAARAAAAKGTAPDAEAARLILESWLTKRSDVSSATQR